MSKAAGRATGKVMSIVASAIVGLPEAIWRFRATIVVPQPVERQFSPVAQSSGVTGVNEL